MLITASVSISIAFAQTSDFQTGYSDGSQQGLSDRHSNVFRIGNICLNQSNSYCNGYLSGYLDGFFSTLPTSTHTTTRIIVHEEHPKCHDNGNMTKPCPTKSPTQIEKKCPDGSVIPITDKCPTVTPPGPTPTPTPTPAPAPPSTPSTPSTPSDSSSIGSSSSGSSSTQQPTKILS